MTGGRVSVGEGETDPIDGDMRQRDMCRRGVGLMQRLCVGDC